MKNKSKINVRNEIKSYITRNGWTITDVVKEMNKNRPDDQRTTQQNISSKLSRGTIKYSEVLEIAEICGYSIEWVDKEEG